MSKSYELLAILNETYLGIISYSPLYFSLDINFCLSKNLIDESSDRPVIIVTNQVEMMNKILDSKLNPEDKNESIIREKIIVYDYEDIRQLTNIFKSIIIIDDVKQLGEKLEGFGNRNSVIEFYRNININNNYLLLTADDNVNIEDLSKVILQKDEVENSPIFLSFKNYFKENNSFSFPVINNTTLHPCRLNKLQKYYFKKYSQVSTTKDYIKDIITATYEPEAEEFIRNTEPTGNEEDEYKKIPNLDDLYDFLGTTKDNIKPLILKNSPKIIKLFDTIDIVSSDKNKKHLIYVNTPSDYHGISLIYATFLRFIQDKKTFVSENPKDGILVSYENNPFYKRDFVIQAPEDEDNINRKIELIKLFNEDFDKEDSEKIERDYIFLTNCDLPEFQSDDGTKIEFLKGITDFHILTMNDNIYNYNIEGNTIDINIRDSEICMNLIKKLFKKENYKSGDISLNIHLYYISETKETLEVLPKAKEDFENFNKFIKELKEKYDFFLYRWKKGLEMSFTDGEFQVDVPIKT